ncbi:MAG: hypothetical protein IKH17_08485 [Bacteroidales bacterium]|nr:hypothetical protein [Bacteroidales bacterium]MBR3097900.1 hypothetical protein [Bacteroidales bacterium]MBR6883764.1 hypothetical protein [Bacteroidales bacterium]
MKKIDIQNAVNAYGRIPVNKVKDDIVRNTLIYDYRRLRKVSREIEEERTDLVEKFQADFAVEAEEARALRQQGKAVTGAALAPFLKAEAELNRAVRAMFREDVVLELQTVPMDDFVKAVKDGDYTFEDLSALDGIVLE